MDDPLFIFKPNEKPEIEKRLKQGEIVQLEPTWNLIDYSKLVIGLPLYTFNKEHEKILLEQCKMLFKEKG